MANYILLGSIALGAIVLFIIIRWILSLRRIVHPNEVHIVRKGRKTLIYGSGLAEEKTEGNTYYKFPLWLPGIGVDVAILPLSVFNINLDNFNAFDKEKVPFMVDITAFFRISDYRLAATRIGSIPELEKQLKTILQGSSRFILAQDNLETIMVERSKYGRLFTDDVKEQLPQWGVETVKNIELMDIRDSGNEQVIANIMNKKKSVIEKESRIEVAKNMQEAKEAEIAAKQAIDIKEQNALEKVGIRQAEASKNVGIEQEKSKQDVQEQAKITKEREMNVQRVGSVQQAEIEKETALVNADAAFKQAEIDKKTVIINAEAAKNKLEIDAEAARKKVEIDAAANRKKVETEAEADKNKRVFDAEAVFTFTTKEAEANLVKMTNNAKGIQAEGEAKAAAEKLLQLALIAAQIDLAKEIGTNEGYQKYLLNKQTIEKDQSVEIRKMEALQAVGEKQAENLKNANFKIMANSVEGGLSKFSDLFSAKGGFNMGTILEGLEQTEIGGKLVEKFLGKDGGKDSFPPVDGKKKKD